MTEFEGDVRSYTLNSSIGKVKGTFHWLDEGSRTAHVAGEFVVKARQRWNLNPDCRRWFDPYSTFDVEKLMGRCVVMDIPGVGRNEVKLRGKPEIQQFASSVVPQYDYTTIKYPTVVTFEATAPPIPIATTSQLRDVLRFAIHDVLVGAGEDDLAKLALAAAVALGGFPKETKIG